MFNIKVQNPRVNQGDSGLRKFFAYVYQNVGAGLLLCGAVSFLIANSQVMLNVLFGTPLWMVVLFAPLGISLYMRFNFQNMSVQKAENLYWLYTALVGASLSVILLAYTAASIASSFFIAAGVFWAAAYYGKTTDADLSSMRGVLFVGLIGILIAMLVNMFMQSTMFAMLISMTSVVLFTALIAYENQNLKNLYYTRMQQDELQKIAIIGSLMLFISFVNLFIHILRLIGTRKD